MMPCGFTRTFGKGEEEVGELHSWEDSHPIHGRARASCSHRELKIAALGSFHILPAKLLPYIVPALYGCHPR